MIRTHLQDNKGCSWPHALPFVQWKYNNRLHAAIKKTPYQCVYGSKPRVGLDLKSLGCTEAVAAEIQDEEQLDAALEELGIASTQEKCSESDRLADESQSEIIRDANVSGLIEGANEDIASAVAKRIVPMLCLAALKPPYAKGCEKKPLNQ